MIVTANNIEVAKRTKAFEVNLYREQLLRYIEDYGVALRKSADLFSDSANEKATIILAHMCDNTNPDLNKDFIWAVNNIGNKTRMLVDKYLREIMLLLGNICECIIIDRCKKDPILNMKCINYACFRPYIDECYNDIPYNSFTPFSPSHKRIVLYTDGGIMYYKDNRYVLEINHVNKDIIWCNKECTEEILKVHIPKTRYNNDARLQIKTSTNYNVLKYDLDEDKYRFSPIIYFDLNRDIDSLMNYLSKKKSGLWVESARNFDTKLMEECDTYFKLLAGHFSGLIDLKNTFEYDLTNMSNGIINHLFNTDIQRLLSDDSITKSENLLEGLQNAIVFHNKENVITLCSK